MVSTLTPNLFKPKDLVSDAAGLVFILLLALIFAGIAVNSVLQRSAAERTLVGSSLLPVSASEVIGASNDFQGSPHSEYILVEYGDYQCPPCHLAAARIPSLLSQYQGHLKFAFRNLPLTSIHPYAMKAAVFAETARRNKNFWPIHDELYRIDAANFNNDTLNRLVRTDHIYLNRKAMLAVDADVLEARKLGVTGTPTFFLCTPKGGVYHLPGLDQIGSYMKNN